MAVQGKLVPQDPADEPASELLRKIREEKKRLIREGKIKKPKIESEIFKRDGSWFERIGKEEKCIDKELPFEIPESWAWVRLGGTCNIGMNVTVSPELIPKDANIIELEDIEKDSGKLIKLKRLDNIKLSSNKNKFIKGNVLLSKLRPNLNKTIVASFDGYCSSEILALNFGINICAYYMHYIFLSPYYVSFAIKHSYGTKMPRLNLEKAKNLLIPLPPLAEQKRIAEKVSRFMEIEGRMTQAPKE